jgi:predicted nucleic acid-binding protein
MHLVGVNALHGKGLGWIDVHLLASALLSHVPIWTRDRRLAAAAKHLEIAWMT